MADETHEVERTIAMARPAQARPATELDEVGHYLIILEGGDPGRRILVGQTPLTVGREVGRDLVLVDTEVSRFHLQLAVVRDAVVVEDRQSTNGTFIDGKRVIGASVLNEGSLLQVGHHVLKLERHSKRDIQRAEEIERDLDKAGKYVRSLLPAPLLDGPIRTDWHYQPSALLGGDALGYDWLDKGTFVVYLIDVSGHGVGAAMHSVGVMNVLRQRALSAATVREPAAALAALNSMFQMERHDGMYFTMWYGVFDAGRGKLRYACAGHHPGYLVDADRRTAVPLKTPGLMIGAATDVQYRSDEVLVAPGSALYLFSDGVFEIVDREGRQRRLHDFVPKLVEAQVPGASESERLYAAVKAEAPPGPLEDDVSLLVVTFT